jgi:hypothetical protein
LKGDSASKLPRNSGPQLICPRITQLCLRAWLPDPRSASLEELKEPDKKTYVLPSSFVVYFGLRNR